MIVCCFRGGMGNQLREYAFARYLSLKADMPLGANTYFYSPANSHTHPRKFELGKFCCSFDHTTEENWMVGDPIMRDGKVLPYYLDADSSIPDMIEQAKNGTLESCALTGWWQDSSNYLQDETLRQILLEDFAPRTAIDAPAFAQYKVQIDAARTSIAIHVRRGDYLKLKDLYSTLRKDYYKTAISRITDDPASASILVFSDDIDQVKSEDLFEVDVTYVETGSHIIDFHLYQCCQHSITANSTFSWWAAYLNDNPGKKVIAPRVHFTRPDFQESYEAHPRALNGWELV